MKMLISIVFICLYLSGYLFSQEKLNLNYLGYVPIGDKAENKLDYQSIKGSPYLHQEFTKGFMLSNSNDTIKEVLLKFDAYLNTFELISNNNDTVVLDPENALSQSFVISYFSENYISKKMDEAFGFIKLIGESKDFNIYSSYTVDFIPEEKSVNNYEMDKPAKFTDIKSVFYMEEKASAIIYKITKVKHFYDIFGKNSVKNAVKNHDLELSFSTGNDIVNLIKLMN